MASYLRRQKLNISQYYIYILFVEAHLKTSCEFFIAGNVHDMNYFSFYKRELFVQKRERLIAMKRKIQLNVKVA